MLQNIFLLRLSMSGIKNIEKQVTLDFYKKTIDKAFNIDDYRVKAIYGENGSGKTGIVYGAYILKKLMLDSNYLGDNTNQRFLSEVINKTTEKLYIECEFYSTILPFNNVYRYMVSLSKEDTGRYVISSESLLTRKSTYATSKFIEVYSVKAGEIQFNDNCIDNDLQDELRSSTVNLLDNKTFLSFLFKYNTAKKNRESEFRGHVVNCWLFSLMLITSFDKADQPEIDFYIRESFKMVWQEIDHKTGNVKTGKVYPKIDSFVGNKRLVKKEDYPDYEKDISRLLRFLQLFKSDLQGIRIEKVEQRDYYECSLILDYGTYSISMDYESTGIVKLIRLYDLMSLAMDGKIVFIDEMDSNINDVYLCKLVEFFTLYGEGQLCFTTHNTSPMTVLRNSKNAIDFLSCDNQIIPWKKTGNFSPESLYRHGMIERLPFNIEPEDFLGILGE